MTRCLLPGFRQLHPPIAEAHEVRISSELASSNSRIIVNRSGEDAMYRALQAGCSALVMLLLSMNASAQQATPSEEHATTLNVFAGAGTDSSQTGPVAGMAMGWEATPLLALEGSGSWLDRGDGADAFAAAFKVQARLQSLRTVVPYVEAGFGMYRAWFDPDSTAIPEFYQNRITATDRTVTDPAFVVGGGVSVFASRRISIRPEIETLLVRDHGRNYFVTTFAARLAYHFGDRPITQAGRRR
jgi:hypothetical protein